MQPTFTPATSTDPDAVIIPATSLSVESPFSNIDTSAFGNFFSVDGLLSLWNIIWSIYAVIAYLVAIGLLLIYVYASTRKKQLDELQKDMVHEREKIYDERFRTGTKNNRLEDALKHISSENPNDWKLAIIEADIILDGALKAAGYGGASLGERLRSIPPSKLNSLNDAWEAHKVRNQIAHAGADFVLTRRLAEETIKQYRRVFAELGIG